MIRTLLLFPYIFYWDNGIMIITKIRETIGNNVYIAEWSVERRVDGKDIR